jgi:YbbR domain-containing protein
VSVEIPTVNRSPLRVLSYSPSEVIVSLEQIVSVSFPLMLEVTGEPALGFQAGSPSIDVSMVTVTGPESRVSEVVSASATVDISGARETFERNLGVQLLDEDGQAVTGLVLAPNRVAFTLPISQLGRYRELAVQVNTEGQWATGYRLTSISVSPPTVTVFSEDPDQVNALPGFVETEPIDLTDAQDDIAATVALNLPEGVTLVGRETVFVQVSIAAIEDNLIVTLPVEILGLSPEFSVTLSPETVEVILFGPLPVLENLTSSNVRVVIDLTGLGEGIWQVEPLVDILPDQVQEQGINPVTVEVTIAIVPTPTSTVTPSTTPGPGS